MSSEAVNPSNFENYLDMMRYYKFVTQTDLCNFEKHDPFLFNATISDNDVQNVEIIISLQFKQMRYQSRKSSSHRICVEVPFVVTYFQLSSFNRFNFVDIFQHFFLFARLSVKFLLHDFLQVYTNFELNW